MNAPLRSPAAPFTPLLVLLAVFAVFWPAFQFEFVGWDDLGNVATNPDMNHVTARSVARYWSGPYRNMYIPLAYTAWSGVAAIARTPSDDGRSWSLNPWVFHAANVLVHAASSLVVFAILRRLLPPHPRRDWAACAGAILFAVHPVQVEPVAWVTGLRDLLSGLLALSALWLYLLHVQTPDRRLKWPAYAAGGFCFALALLTKPAVMTLPLGLLALDYFLLHRPLRTAARSAAGWLLIALPIAALTLLVQPAAAVAPAPLWSRPLVALDAITFYAAKLVAPLHLGIDYGRSPAWLLAHPALYWTWLPAAAVGGFLLVNARRWPRAACAAAFFVAMLLPVLGLATFDFQRHSTPADRYLYLSMLAVALVGAWLVQARPTRLTAALATCLLLACAARAHLQVWTWQDSRTLYTHAVEVNPTTLAGNDGLGNMALAANRVDEAIPRFQAAVAGHPTDPIANYNLANALTLAGRPREAAAAYRLALAGPQFSFVYANYAVALAQSGDLPAAARAAEEGLDKWPDEPRLHLTLASVFAAQKDWPAAAEEYAAALRLSPGLAPAQQGLDAARRHLAPATQP